MGKGTFLITGLLVACGVGAAVGWLLFGDTIQERWRRQRFDPVAWQGPKSFTNDARIRMVDDLLRRHSFRGMTREQVIAVAGEADNTEYFKDWDLVYWLGPERRWMGIDSEWLVFRLDSRNKVTDYRIVND